MRHLVGLVLIGLAAYSAFIAFRVFEVVYAPSVPGSLMIEHLLVIAGFAVDAFWAGMSFAGLAMALFCVGGLALFGSSAAAKHSQ
jgi:hypothetical protein